MQLSIASFALFAFAGVAMAAPQSDDPYKCVEGGFYYGEDACSQQCQGGTCTISAGHENDPDYICVCDGDLTRPGCGDMVKGKDTCEGVCTSGNCVQLLIGYNCSGCP